MAYFLRFTDTASEDLERNSSLLDLPSLSKTIELEGLCGYSFADNEEFERIMTQEEIEEKIGMYKQNTYYKGKAVLFKGEYIKQNPNSEGVIFNAEGIYKEY